MTDPALIEVVCVDMSCFKVHPDTLEPVGSSYYEPAALTDPRGPQISHGEWCQRLNAKWDAQMRAFYRPHP